MKVSSQPAAPAPRPGNIVDDTLKVTQSVGEISKSLAGAGSNLKPLATEAVISLADGYVGHALSNTPELTMKWVAGIGGAAHVFKAACDVLPTLEDCATTDDIPRASRGFGHLLTGAGLLGASFGAGGLALPLIAAGAATRLGGEWAVNADASTQKFARYGTELSMGGVDCYLAYANQLAENEARVPVQVASWGAAAGHLVKGAGHFYNLCESDEKKYHGAKMVGEALKAGGLVTAALGGGTHSVALTGFGLMLSLAADVSRE